MLVGGGEADDGALLAAAETEALALDGDVAALGDRTTDELVPILDEAVHVLVGVRLPIGDSGVVTVGVAAAALGGADPGTTEGAEGQVAAPVVVVESLGGADGGNVGERVVGVIKVKGVDHVGHVGAAPGSNALILEALAVGLGPRLKEHDVRGVVTSLGKDIATTGPRGNNVAGDTGACIC